MAENIVYSKPISVFTTVGRGRRVKKTYKLKVTDRGRKETSNKTGDDAIGRPILTYEVLRYDTQSEASESGGDNGVVVATKSSEVGARFAFTASASETEKRAGGRFEKDLRPAIDDAARKMMLEGGNNARLAESFKELGSGDLTSLAETINPDGQSSPAGLSNILAGRVPTKVLSTQAIKYPLDLRSEDQDVLKIVIKERKPRRLQGGVQADRDQSGVTAATIFLPITGTVQDTLSVSYSQSTLNFAEAAGLQALREILIQGEEEKGKIGGGFGAMIDNMAMPGNSKSLQDLVGAGVAANVLQSFGSRTTTQSLLSRQTGQTMNPNMELLFKSPELRNFSFQYRFSPRSANEGRVVKQIINFFKRSMVPKKQNGGAFFLTSPDVFMLQYLHKGQPHTSLNKFKTCALKTCNVNYAPDGTYATFPDGVMHSYVMTLGFTEIDPVYSEDYGSSDEDFGNLMFAPTFAEMFDGGGSSGQSIGF